MIRNEVFRDGTCVSAEIIDLAANTITFEEAGVARSTRPLTADEFAAYTPPAPTLTADERLDAARAVLAQVDAIEAPVAPIDVAEILIQLREVL